MWLLVGNVIVSGADLPWRGFLSCVSLPVSHLLVAFCAVGCRWSSLEQTAVGLPKRLAATSANWTANGACSGRPARC